VVASVAEDALAVVSILLAVFFPIAVFFIIAAGLVVSFWLLPKVIRFFRDAFRRMRDTLRRFRQWLPPATT
jgi:hypothetical protein